MFRGMKDTDTFFLNMYSTKMGTYDDARRNGSNLFQLSTVSRRIRTATTLSRTCVKPAKFSRESVRGPYISMVIFNAPCVALNFVFILNMCAYVHSVSCPDVDAVTVWRGAFPRRAALVRVLAC